MLASIKIPLLKIQGKGDPSHSFFVVIVQLYQGWGFFFDLLHFLGGRFLWFGGEGGAGAAEVSGLPAVEAEPFFLALFAFFWGKFRDLDGIYVHRVGVTGFRGGWGERLVRVGRFNVSPSDFVGTIPLGLEMNGFLIPGADSGRDGVHGHDTVHERWGNPG